MQTGKAIAATLTNSSTQEKMPQFELGFENIKVVPGKFSGTQYVPLEHCPLREVFGHIPGWPEDALKLVVNCNRNPPEGGGGESPALSIVQRGIRENNPNQVTTLACRSETTGAIVISEADLETAGLTREEPRI